VIFLIKSEKNEFCKGFSRPAVYATYVFILNALIVIAFLLLFQYPKAPSVLTGALGTIYFFKGYFIEILLLTAIGALLVNGPKVLRVTGYLAFGTYFFVNSMQLIMYYFAGRYITGLMLENAIHITYLITRPRFLIGCVAFLIIFLLPLIIERLRPSAWRPIANWVLALVLFATFFLLSLSWVSPKVQHFANTTFEMSQVSEYSPSYSFFKGLFRKFITVSLSKEDLILAHNFDIQIQPNTQYPLVKNWIYQGRAPFPIRKMASKKPNIIVFFVEGMSARLLAPYNNLVKDLTPNISTFASHQDSMIITNYFNHTAATYHGIHGQMCSLYPFSSGTLGITKSMLHNKYFSLTNYLSDLGYKTHFFYTQRRDDTSLDELAGNIGFEDIVAGEELSHRYLSNASFIRKEALSDQQLFAALINFLHSKNKGYAQPFFLAVYNFETHAFLDIAKDGKKFGNGDNSVLNSTYNFDSAFGLFWKEFLTSELAQNTIVILTADHAHYPEKSFIDIATSENQGYQHLFFDRIPFIIYDPTRAHPANFNAEYRSSLDFAPSLIHYLGFPNVSNPFNGSSIFDKTTRKGDKIALASVCEDFYWADENGIQSFNPTVINKADITRFEKIVRYLKMLDVEDRIWPSNPSTDRGVAITGLREHQSRSKTYPTLEDLP